MLAQVLAQAPDQNSSSMEILLLAILVSHLVYPSIALVHQTLIVSATLPVTNVPMAFGNLSKHQTATAL